MHARCGHRFAAYAISVITVISLVRIKENSCVCLNVSKLPFALDGVVVWFLYSESSYLLAE